MTIAEIIGTIIVAAIILVTAVLLHKGWREENEE
jgi:preprotein translocase subunit SecG